MFGRYGLKGAVYVKNREGQVVSEGQDHTCEWQNGSVHRYPDHISTVCSTGTMTFNLFQHITVSRFTLHKHTIQRFLVSEEIDFILRRNQSRQTIF